MAATIYIIEDDSSIRNELVQLLELQDYSAHFFSGSDFSLAAKAALAEKSDCIILDLNLPNANGHAICRDIRSESDVPIIIVTSSESEFDEVMGMNLGADDYIKKPYSAAVLMARIQSVLRRRNSAAAGRVLSVSGVSLDVGNGVVSFDGKSVELTRNEQKILESLMRNPGSAVTRQRLMGDLWESDEFVDDNTLTVNVSRLREKLFGIGVPEGFLATRRSIGYCLKKF